MIIMKKRKIIRVFVASPDDVKPEREVLEEIVKELNDLWSDSLGVYLQLVKWESHSYPDISSDPQAVINKQIGDDYEVFIGILWFRFGTPTPRAESGTIEEFERAYSRFSKNPDDIKVMFYFKDQAVPPSKMVPDQLSQIHNFRDRLGKLGTLHWSFDDTEDFSKYLRMHLSRQMQYWKDRPLMMEKTDNSVDRDNDDLQAIIEESEIIEEEGFLDLVEKGTENFEMLSEVSRRMTDEMTKLMEYTQKNTVEIQAIDMSGGKNEVKKAKRLINQMAGQLDIFNKRFEAEIPLYWDHYSTAIDSYGKAATLLTDFDKNVDVEIQDALKVVTEIKNSSLGVRDSIASYREVIASLPRVTTRFNRAKRNCISILDSFYKEIESGINLTIEVENTIKKLLS